MYKQIAIFRTREEIPARSEASHLSKIMGQIPKGSRVYVDKFTNRWGRICYVNHNHQDGGEMVLNGKWIRILNTEVTKIWAKDGSVERRQQFSLPKRGKKG